jgi:hypothetical protein
LALWIDEEEGDRSGVDLVVNGFQLEWINKILREKGHALTISAENCSSACCHPGSRISHAGFATKAGKVNQ